MALSEVALDDKYRLESGRIYLTGIQALVRLPLMQRRRDRLAGLNTAGLVTGYRGSPLGGLDKECWAATDVLDAHHVRFQPAVNEDLAATAVWGSQQVSLFEGARYDGVFAMWYAKGPGVDRCGDVFRHANFAGTARHGGVLLLAGDDPVPKSSTIPSQSEYAFMDAQIPVLHPAGVQDVLDFGILGWEMSRFSGCWVAMKTIAETVDCSASVSVDPARPQVVRPDDVDLPPDGVHIRWPDWPPRDAEIRLQRHKLYAALAFARANGLDRTIIDSPHPRFGILTTGKSFADVMQALDDLGIDAAQAAAIGLRVRKVGLTWPLEPEGTRHFAEGLEEILVVEEKRAVIENQLKEQLYNWREDVRPRIMGKFDERREWVLPSAGELTPARIARVIAERIRPFHATAAIDERLAFLADKERAIAASVPDIRRIPYYCAGCPHNTSTRVPTGSRAVAGIGCHFMATWMDRDTETFTHMGAEGANWIGQAPFTDTPHIFVNLGDGTYFHSGILAIRAAVAAGVSITYKILYNDAVAMTGGQPIDGPISVPLITRQVAAEGVGRIALVSEDPARWRRARDLAPGVTVHDRDDLDQVQRELRERSGVTVLIYEQTCAAEKRRRRKRGLMADPAERVFINQAVCEGCGDCGTKSNCVAIVPVETELGRRRAIDQSSCNKDFSCVKGLCPSFVTVHGGRPRRRAAVAPIPDVPLPEPPLPDLSEPYGIVITGIGGTGVVTVGALLGMAAHLDGKGVTVLDQTGLAQKNGAVVSHVRVAERPEALFAPRIAACDAHVLLGCDLVTSGGPDAVATLRRQRSQAVVNSHRTMTADFTRDADLAFPADALQDTIRGACADAEFIDAGALAAALLGDAIAANLFMVGFAWQRGLLPVSAAAVERAIELNGVAVDLNRQAFQWGRRAAHDRAAVEQLAGIGRPPEPLAVDDFVTRRARDLAAFQDRAYARRYTDLVDRVRAAEAAVGDDALTGAVARAYFKLLAYKDEYEVARLFSDGEFRRALDDQFEGPSRLAFHLAPPLFAARDPITGEPRKRRFGPWIMGVFRLLARLRWLRGTPFDPFRHSADRRLERRLITDYEATIEALIAGLDAENHALAVEIAALPLTVRGFGVVKERAARAAKEKQAELLAAFHAPTPHRTAAE